MQTIVDPNCQLAKVANECGLAQNLTHDLIEAFMPDFTEAFRLSVEAKDISVTDATQVTEMRQAFKMRRALADVRVAAEKKRKAMKEESLRMSQSIDKVAKVIPQITEPAEAALLEMEKFAERAEAERKAKLKASRESLLRPFGVDVSIYPLADMTEAAWSQLLDGTRLAFEARKAAEAKAEADRVAAAKAAHEEQLKVRAENERLHKENEEKDRAAQAEREKSQAEQRARDAAAKAERDRIEAAAAKERAEAAAKLKAEQDARATLEAEAEARRKAEAKRIADEAKAKKKADAAPDAVKVRAIIGDLQPLCGRKFASEDVASRVAAVLIETARRLDAIAQELES